MNWGCITYEVPLKKYPDTYSGQPLCYAALATQKNHLALYLMNVYGDPKLARTLKDGFRKAGKTMFRPYAGRHGNSSEFIAGPCGVGREHGMVVGAASLG